MILNLLRYIYKYRTHKRFKLLTNQIGINKTIQLLPDIIVSSPEDLTIGNYVYIGPRAVIQAVGKVNIGRGVIFGPDLRIYSTNHNFRNAESIPYDNKSIKKSISIGDNVWVGGNVTIIPGTIIGEGSIIGAGTVVSGVIPKMSIVIGNPSKIISKRDEEHYNKLKQNDKIYLKLKQQLSIKK